MHPSCLFGNIFSPLRRRVAVGCFPDGRIDYRWSNRIRQFYIFSCQPRQFQILPGGKRQICKTWMMCPKTLQLRRPMPLVHQLPTLHTTPRCALVDLFLLIASQYIVGAVILLFPTESELAVFPRENRNSFTITVDDTVLSCKCVIYSPWIPEILPSSLLQNIMV